MRLSEFRRLSFWLAVGLSAMLWSILLSSCAVPKNMEQESHMDYSDVLQKMHIRMDSLLYNMIWCGRKQARSFLI